MDKLDQLFPPKDDEKKRQPSGSNDSLESLFPDKAAQRREEPEKVRSGEGLREIGDAPELNKVLGDGAGAAFKASLGLLTSRTDEDARNVLKSQFPEATFSKSDQGTIVTLPSGDYLINRKGISGQDLIQFVTDLAAFTPAGRAGTVAGSVIKSGATEAGLQATNTAVGGDGVDAKDVGFAAGLGGAGKQAENFFGTLIDAYKSARAPAGNSAERQLVQEADQLGIPTMTSDVMPSETFAEKMILETGEKVPVAGTGAARAAQQEAREQALENFINQYGTPSYRTVIQSLKNRKDKIKTAAGNVLERTGQQLDNAGEIPLDNTFKVLDQVEQELSKKGVIGSSPALDNLYQLMDALTETPTTSFSALKENRTAFRDLINGFDSAERSQLGSRANALLQRVSDAMSSDMRSFAKQNLSPREYQQWRKANSVYQSEANALKKSRLKSVLDRGDITPEAVQGMLFSQKDSELELLYRSLTNEGRAAARAAIIDKVIQNLSRRSSGVSPNSFASELNKFGKPINVFFKGDEKRQLMGFKRVLEATRRAQDFSVTTPTGQAALGAGAGLAAFIAPAESIGSALTLGSMSRIYESRPVRNALIALSEVKPDTVEYRRALKNAQSVITAAAQSELRREQEEEQQ